MSYERFLQEVRNIIINTSDKSETLVKVYELIRTYVPSIILDRVYANIEKILPIVVTNDDDNDRIYRIEAYINEILTSRKIDALLMAGPYISKYFVEYIKKSPVKVIRIIIDKNPTDYTLDAIRSLFAFNYLDPPYRKIVQIRKRTDESRFLHMKLMIPFFRTDEKYYAPCALVGSVNFTKNGIRNNDEIMVLLRDEKSISACVNTLDRLWNNSKDVRIRDLV